MLRRFDLANAVGDRCGLDDELAAELAAAGAVRIILRGVDATAPPRCSEGDCPFTAGDVGDGLALCSEHRRARFAGRRVGLFNQLAHDRAD